MIALTGEQLKAGAESLASELHDDIHHRVVVKIDKPSASGGWLADFSCCRDDSYSGNKMMLTRHRLNDERVTMRAIMIAVLGVSCPNRPGHAAFTLRGKDTVWVCISTFETQSEADAARRRRVSVFPGFSYEVIPTDDKCDCSSCSNKREDS